MAIQWPSPITFLLNTDFTFQVVMDVSMTGKTVKFVIRKEPEDATAAYSVTSGITFSTTTLTDDTVNIPIAATGTDAMQEGEYHAAVWRTDSSNQRPGAYGRIIAVRAAAPP